MLQRGRLIVRQESSHKTVQKSSKMMISTKDQLICPRQTSRSTLKDSIPGPDIANPIVKFPTLTFQIQLFYIHIFLLLSSSTMIDSSFGQILTEPYNQQEALVAGGEWEIFAGGKAEPAVLSELYQNCIILQFKTQHTTSAFQVPLDFDLKFELLREKSADKAAWTIDDIYAIRFQKGDHTFELRHPHDQQQLLLWREHLTRCINQLGFHELFRPLKEIGRGAFASVYLVQSYENGQQYAVKAFSKQALAAEENGLRGLKNEIEIMRTCSHRNLMKMQGVYESRNSLYICVELLSGGQLYDLIKAKHKFTSQQIRAVMRALLSGVQAMHAKGYMHRDLKPQNVLFRQSGGECVIADFGLAESAGGELIFVRCGTPGYVAPEIANLKSNKAAYTTACDLFSLGVIFHILALGKSPFPGKNFDEVLDQNRNCKINFETFEYNQLPTSWFSLLKGLLEKDPKKRLTASQALAHQFFKKEPLIARLQKEREKEREKENREPMMGRAPAAECNSPLPKDKKLSIECNSPLMLTRNQSRKTPGLLRDDSCLKFKMKDTLMTGNINQGKQFPPISPLMKQKQPFKPFESRFKQIAQQNS